MATDRFATVRDYEERYGEVEDERALMAVLDDATGVMLAAYEARVGRPYAVGDRPTFDANARSVCRSIAHRAMCAPDGVEGATQLSRAAGQFSASVTYANPTGDVWLGKSDLRALGLSGGRVGFAGVLTHA